MTIEKILDDCANTIRQQEAALLAEQKHNEMLMAEIEALKNRELTDEEIVNILNEICGNDKYIEVLNMIIFARTILKKAGEK